MKRLTFLLAVAVLAFAQHGCSREAWGVPGPGLGPKRLSFGDMTIPADMTSPGDLTSPIAFVSEAHGTYDSQTGAYNGASITGVTANNTLIFISSHTCDSSGSTAWDPVPTDSSGQTWTALNRPGCLTDGGGTGANVSLWYLFSANSGTHTLTTTFPGNTWGNWAIAQFFGLSAVDAVTTGDGESGAAAAVTTGSTQTTSTTANAVEIVVVGLATNTTNAGLANTAFSNPPSGYSSIMVQNDTTAHAGAQISYRRTTTTGAQTATWTWTNTGNNAETVWRATIGVLK